MSFEDLDVDTKEIDQRASEFREKQVELFKTFHRTFTTDDGKKVLDFLTKRFLIDNVTPVDFPNVDYLAAYKNGEAGIVRVILSYISQAEAQ